VSESTEHNPASAGDIKVTRDLCFSDFAKDHLPMTGTKLDIGHILNKKIYITGYKVAPSKYEGKSVNGNCLTIQYQMDGTEHITFTGSGVLQDQLKQYSDQLPFWATIVQIDRFYTLT